MTYNPVSATSAIMPNAKSIEKVGKSTDFGVLDSGMADGSLAEVAEKAPSTSFAISPLPPVREMSGGYICNYT